MDRRENALCKLHTLKAVQIGSCIVCSSASPICETKGCIKHHLQSEKMHTSYTLKEIEQITSQFISSNNQKRGILTKLVNEYFHLLKSQIESLYHEVEHSLSNLRFENFLMDNRERELAQLLVMKKYSELTCHDVARVIPKMIKCSSFEEKQFIHLKDYLQHEKQNLTKTVNSMILNLPYFRQDQTIVTVEKFTEVSDQLLSKVNNKLQSLTFRPKKLKIKYSEDEGIEIQRQRFIKLLESNPNLKEIEVFQLYCVWNIKEDDFQIDFMDAVLAFPFLSALTIYTGYRVTSTAFIEEMVENKNIQLKVYKKPWHF